MGHREHANGYTEHLEELVESITNAIVFPDMDDDSYTLTVICRILKLNDETISYIRNSPETMRDFVLDKDSDA